MPFADVLISLWDANFYFILGINIHLTKNMVSLEIFFLACLSFPSSLGKTAVIINSPNFMFSFDILLQMKFAEISLAIFSKAAERWPELTGRSVFAAI